MRQQEPRMCGICKLTLREGSPDPVKIRITDADVDRAAEQVVTWSEAMKKAPAAGLYHACQECFTLYAPIVEARVRAELPGEVFTDHHYV